MAGSAAIVGQPVPNNRDCLLNANVTNSYNGIAHSPTKRRIFGGCPENNSHERLYFSYSRAGYFPDSALGSWEGRLSPGKRNKHGVTGTAPG